MHGNVWQWCSDVYGEYPHQDVVDPMSLEGSNWRMCCVGIVVDRPDGLSVRLPLGSPDYRFDFVGFRVVLDSR